MTCSSLSLSLSNLILYLCILSSALLLVLLPHFPSLLTSQLSQESVSVYGNYLRYYFSVSYPKVMCSTARGTCLSSAEPRCPEESHSSFYSLFFPAEFLSATTNLFLSTATGLDKDVYPMQKHLPRSGMDFLHIFYLSCSLHFFPSIWSRQHQQVCHTSSLPLRLSFYPFHPFLCHIFPFKLNSLTQTFLSSFTLRMQWVSGHSFLPGNDAADELARQRALFLTSAISFFLGLEAYCLI